MLNDAKSGIAAEHGKEARICTPEAGAEQLRGTIGTHTPGRSTGHAHSKLGLRQAHHEDSPEPTRTGRSSAHAHCQLGLNLSPPSTPPDLTRTGRSSRYAHRELGLKPPTGNHAPPGTTGPPGATGTHAHRKEQLICAPRAGAEPAPQEPRTHQDSPALPDRVSHRLIAHQTSGRCLTVRPGGPGL